MGNGTRREREEEGGEGRGSGDMASAAEHTCAIRARGLVHMGNNYSRLDLVIAIVLALIIAVLAHRVRGSHDLVWA